MRHWAPSLLFFIALCFLSSQAAGVADDCLDLKDERFKPYRLTPLPLPPTECPPISDHGRFKIHNETKGCPDTSLLIKTLNEGIAAFEKEFGPVEGDFIVRLGAGLAAGYSVKDDELKFASTTKTIDSGLKSEDVQLHELFHQLSCRKFPRFCDLMKKDPRPVEAEAIAEATADFFAYKLRPDGCFGENFLTRAKCVRPYKTDLDYALTGGEHGKGAVLTSHLVSSSTSMADLKRYFEGSDHSLKALVKPSSWDKFSLGEKRVESRVFSANMRSRFNNSSFVMNTNEGSVRIEFNETLRARYPRASARLVPEEGRATSVTASQATAVLGGYEFNLKGNGSGRAKYFVEIIEDGKLIGRERIFIEQRSQSRRVLDGSTRHAE